MRILAHFDPADWNAIIAGAVAGVTCACLPSAIVIVLRWLL